MKIKHAFLTALIAFSAILQAAIPYKATEISGKLQIDGKLDEEAWKGAQTRNEFRSLSNARPNLVAKPEFKIIHDKENIYLGITVRNDDPANLRAKADEHTTNPWIDDVIELFISPSGKYAEFYQLVFGAGGAKWGTYYEEQGNIRPDPYGPIVQSKLYKGDNFWSMEIKIPLRAFYMTQPHQWSDQWLLSVCTDIKRGKRSERATWSDVQRGFKEPKNFRKMGGMPIKTQQMHNNITEVTFNASGQKDGKYTGQLTLNAVVYNPGNYTLEINGEKSDMMPLKRGANKFNVPAAFPALGKNITLLNLYDSNNNLVVERFYPVSVSFQPISFDFDKPSYGQCFFPGQDASRLKGSISIKVNTDKVHFKGAGQDTFLKVKDGKADFDFSLKKFDEKDFRITATVGEYSKEARIRILPPVEKGNMGWIEDGRIYMNGKPVVIRSFYCIAGLAEKQITYQCSNLMEKYYKPASRKMPVQDFASFRNSVQLANINKTIESKEATKDQEPSQMVYDWYRERIEKSKNKDFFCYYLSDEPECRGVSPIYLKYLYDFIKDLDPYHPVFIISRSPVAYMDCCDIMAPHPYNLPQVDIRGKRSYHRDFEVVDRMCAAAKNKGLKNKILLLCNEAYGSLGDNIYADILNFDEINADVWLLFANGGMGLFPYIWYDHCTRPEQSKAFDFCYQSMERLEKYIIDCIEESELEVSNPNIRARLTMPFGKPMLIMVNKSTEPQQVPLKAKDLRKGKKLYSFRQNVSFQRPSKDTLKFDLKPLQWVILTSEKMDEGLRSMEDYKAELVEIRKKIAARGNLLYGPAAKDVSISSSFGGELNLREILFNGWFEGRSWLPRQYKYHPQWIQLSFTNEVPKFSKIRLVGYNCGKAKFKYWKYGEWLDIEPKMTTDGEYEFTFDIGKTISTVKLKAEWAKQNEKLELYEFELLK